MSPNDILVVLGTRPDAIKLAPLIRELRARGRATTVVSTGQHRDLLAPVLAMFHIEVDHELDVMRDQQSLPLLHRAIVDGITDLIERHRPARVVVQGDTTTAFASALAAFYAGIPVAHVEAGLRTHDLQGPFPEEFHRQAIARLADLHFAPTDRAERNLRAESVAGEIHVVGNTIVDALHYVSSPETRSRSRQQGLPVISGSSSRQQGLPVISGSSSRQQGLPVTSGNGLPMANGRSSSGREGLPVISGNELVISGNELPMANGRSSSGREGLPVISGDALPVISGDALPVISGDALPVGERPYVVVTCHRREQGADGFVGAINAIRQVARARADLDFLYPVHPNPVVRRAVEAGLAELDNLVATPPMPYDVFITALRGAAAVLTDSGGVQEEATALGTPVLVMRTASDRPEAIEAGNATLVGVDPDAILAALLAPPAAEPSALYGDGNAARRIADLL